MANDARPDSDPEMAEEKIPKIIGCRRANHLDLPRICEMMGPNTLELFGDVEAAHVYERACLSLVQMNENGEVVSNVGLCNFPNVPSVAAGDWLAWITRHYGVSGVAENNTLFIHLLVWDPRYNEEFLKIVLSDIFAASFYCANVIMIVPPGSCSDNATIFDGHMTRHPPIGESNEGAAQMLYVSPRYREDPKLRIRRVVEEDNDDLIPIIDAESKLLREIYGDYYISEMMRRTEGQNRQLIVAEDEGRATGVMCLNRDFNLDLLIENFELVPYSDLRKPIPPASPISRSTSSSGITSASSSEYAKSTSELVDEERPRNRDRVRFSLAIAQTMRYEDENEGEFDPEGLAEPIAKSIDTFALRQHSRIDASVNFEAVIRRSVFAEAIHELPFRSFASSAHGDDDEDLTVSRINDATVENASAILRQGESNAFVLELFSMRKDIGEWHCLDYLEAAFECFADLDYCAMLIPPTQPFFALLEHFVQVPLRFDRDFPMAMYVTHRAIFSSTLKAREVVSYDRDSIVKFLQGIPKRKIVVDDYDETITYPNGAKHCYVFSCEDQIVGLAVIRTESNVDKLCDTYDVETYVSIKNISRDAQAELIHFVTVPIFSVHHRLFLCEVMSLSSTSVLYYRLYDNETKAVHRTQPLVTCLDAMTPVKFRTRFHHPYPLASNVTSDTDSEKFSLFLTSPRLAMTPRSTVNAKIIVVGASDCGVAFAEYLAFRDSDVVHFTNVTIVSPNGIPFEVPGNTEHATAIPFRGRYCYEYRKFVPVSVWMNVVYGIVSHINRKEKYLVVSGLGALSYDYLVLACGLQYQAPQFQDTKDMEKNDEQEDVPLNCFLVNDDVDAATCLDKLRELTNDFTTKKFIVIYGRNIECHCTLGNLLERGVKGSWIIMIEPKLGVCETPNDVYSGDDEVTEAVKNSIRKFGVKVISGWDLKDWVLEISENVLEDDNTRASVIKSLRVESKTQKKYVACDALIYFGEKRIPSKTFMAISRTGLVFDGRLLIDPDYQTNDPSIFAAGSFTHYSRKYGAERPQHQHYNSIEVGEELAKKMKRKIENNYSSNPKVSSSDNQKSSNVPVFRAPIVLYCRLPGGLNYLHVKKPGKSIERRADIARNANAREVFITGNCSPTSDVGYFRIRFDEFSRVETITCFRKEDFRMQDLINLYGKHESMLNNLKLRFQNSLILDFFAYFGEAWAAALYHDRFDRLRVENRAILFSEAITRENSLIEEAVAACREANGEKLKEEYREHIESKYLGTRYEEGVSSNLINFLQREEASLPMYCNPRKLRRQLQSD